MMRKVIYTCLTGGFDNLQQPLVVDDTFDYICFTDIECSKKDGVWLLKPIYACNIKNMVRLSRYPKILPHLFLQDYDVSIYIDANIQICSNVFYKKIYDHINTGDLISQLPHPTRDCIYLELEQCLNIRKITPIQYIRHRHRFLSSGLPQNHGLFENNVIFRRHNENKVKEIDEMWWKEYNNISQRDQLSLLLVYWILDFYPTLLWGVGKNTRNVSYVNVIQHNREGDVIIPKKHQRFHFIIALYNYILRNSLLKVYRNYYHIQDYYSQW